MNYRFLKAGETLQAGDEWNDDGRLAEWESVPHGGVVTQMEERLRRFRRPSPAMSVSNPWKVNDEAGIYYCEPHNALFLCPICGRDVRSPAHADGIEAHEAHAVSSSQDDVV